MLSELRHLVAREISLELRRKYALNGILLYVVSTIYISYLSFRNIIDPAAWNALFWTILLFACLNAVSKSFIQESRGRLLYLYTLASPGAIILSKILYNMLLVAVLSVLCFLCFSLFIGNLVQNNVLFLIVLLLGSAGLSSVLTLMSAIASKTGNSFSLMAVLSFPIVVPLLLILIKVSKNAVDGLEWSVSYAPLGMLALLNVIVFILAYLLFPYLWRD